MPNSDVYSVNADGVMELAGHDVRELVQEYGSPLVVMLEDVLRNNCRSYLKQLDDYPRTRVYYASKAFLTTGFCRLIEQEGMCLDVVSWGELYTAKVAGFPAERILMHGNAKTDRDLRMALEYGVGRIVIDNHPEVDRLADIAKEMGKTAKVFIRVTPGIKPSTHAYIQTGQVDSKFGFNLNGGAAEEAVQHILKRPELELVGLHCHIGSQIFEVEPYLLAARTMMEFYNHVKTELGAPLDELNLGGGLGIRYMPEDVPPNVAQHLDLLRGTVIEECKRLGLEQPLLCYEPGRSIVGRAGVTLYTVEGLKKIEGVNNYASVDGGMTDNPRFALYNAKHHVLPATRMNEDNVGHWAVAGRCCESGDMLQRDCELPEMQVGDILAFLSTGAYTYSMASHYNRIAKPAVILASKDRVGLLAARDTAEDLIHLDRIPSWL